MSDITDHQPVFAIASPRYSIKQAKSRIVYKDDKISHSLCTENLRPVYEAPSTEDKFDQFLNSFVKHIKRGEFTVTQSRTTVKRKPWLTTALLKSINHKNNMYKTLKRNPQKVSLQNKYKSYNKLLTNLINVSKRNYFHLRIQQANGNTSATWKVINSALNKTTAANAITKLIVNGSLVTSSTKLSKKFNNYFATVTSKIIQNSSGEALIDHIKGANSARSFFLRPVDAQEIYKLLLNLKPTASVGYDAISVSMLKTCATHVKEPLAHIINDMFTTGKFPTRLKI